MSTKALALIVVLLATAAGLAYTNPTSQDYQKFQDQMIDHLMTKLKSAEEGSGQAVINQLVSAKGSRAFLRSFVGSQTVRHNYGLCSVFETELFQTKIEVLGIGTRFVPLTDMEDVLRKLEESVISPDR